MNKIRTRARSHNNAAGYLSPYVYPVIPINSRSDLVFSVVAVESARLNAAVPKEMTAAITVN